MFEDNIKYNNETSRKNYYLSSNIKFKENFINVFKYISNLKITNNNIKKIVSLGRKRWKIENEGFYMQKHRTFNICHMNSRNDNAMKCHYSLYSLHIQLGNYLKKVVFQLGH